MESKDESAFRNDLAIACSEGDYDRAKELLAIGCNPVTSRAGYFNWSPLHYTARQGKLDFAQMLMSQYGCQPQVEDKEGRTPLHVACQYGQLEFAQYLIQRKRCDANYADIEEQTPLHHTCGWLSECAEEEAMSVARYLINRGKADPTLRDVNGKSCVLHACEKGFVSVLRYLVEERSCDLSSVDYKGNNALHLAVSFSNSFAVVEYVMCRGVVELESTNNSKNNVLHMAAIANSSLDICKLILNQAESPSLLETLNESGLTPLDLANDELLHYALTRFQIHSKKFYEKYALTLGVKQSPAPQAKVFVLGNSKSGKTTLVASLQKESCSFSLSFSSQSSSPVPQLVEEGHGLVVTNFESKTMGNLAFYDFSGHVDYASIQESILKYSANSSSLSIIVVDLQKPSQDIMSSVNHWLALLNRSRAVRAADKLKVIIVGSHGDVTNKSQHERLKSITLDKLSFSEFELISKVQIDCHKADHSGMTSLRKQLGRLFGKKDNGSPLSFNASCLLTYLKSRYSSFLAINLETLMSDIRLYRAESGKIQDVRYFLSDDESIITRLLTSLAKEGHICFFENKACLMKSVLLLQAQDVFSDLTKLWSRADSINNNGVVPLTEVSAIFPDMKADILISIFLHLKLCVEVDVHTASPFTLTDTSKQLYFPSLSPASPPDQVWDTRCLYEHHFGWVIKVCNNEKRFPMGFVNIVLSRCLSASMSSLDMEGLSLWRSGMYVKHKTDGLIELLVEAIDDFSSFHFILRAQRVTSPYLQFRSTLVNMVRGSLEEFQCIELLTDPFDVMHYPLPPSEKTTLFALSDVVHSIQANSSTVKSKDNIEISLSDLLYFDPYAIMGEDCSFIYSRDTQMESISEQFLRTLSHAVCCNINKLPLFSHMFAFTQTEFRPCSEEIHSSLLSWAENKTYSDVLRLFESYSVFNIQHFLNTIT